MFIKIVIAIKKERHPLKIRNCRLFFNQLHLYNWFDNTVNII